MKFLFDENLSPSHAARLRGAGHDAVAVLDIGLSGASDSEVRAAAIREGRVLITLDERWIELVVAVSTALVLIRILVIDFIDLWHFITKMLS